MAKRQRDQGDARVAGQCGQGQMWPCVSAGHDLCGCSAMNGMMTMAHNISDIDRASSAAAVQDTDAMIVGSGGSVATGQRAAERMARPRMSLASPHAQSARTQ
jgi:hypothetical protein